MDKYVGGDGKFLILDRKFNSDSTAPDISAPRRLHTIFGRCPKRNKTAVGYPGPCNISNPQQTLSPDDGQDLSLEQCSWRLDLGFVMKESLSTHLAQRLSIKYPHLYF
jgi:hypothetical protein